MIPLHDDNPTELPPFVTIFLIVVCTVVFFWESSLGANMQRAVLSFGAIPAVVINEKLLAPDLAVLPAWATIFTSIFMHGGWMHLIGNMLYLWIFGNNVEDSMGHVKFFIFYMLCGVIAFVAHALQDIHSTVPTVGASGAISGVLGAYLLLYPHARVLVVIPLGIVFHTTRLPASIVLLLWFVLQIFSNLVTGSQGGGVAWGAHIGGFIAGVLLIPLFKDKKHRFFTAGR